MCNYNYNLGFKNIFLSNYPYLGLVFMVVHNEPPPGSRQGQTSPVPIFFKNQSPATSPFPPPKKQFAFREPYFGADSLRFHHFMFF